ncbi:MAG: hypothetical protein IJ367_02075, partial [Clostridia bacterium]|nr:hypothetical protein [Clostridia bacterium]
SACYEVVGAKLQTWQVKGYESQRSFFCFHDYEYYLDVTKQEALMPETKPLLEGLRESYEWYQQHENAVIKRPYMDYIDSKVK